MTGYKDMDELFRLTNKRFRNLILKDEQKQIESSIWEQIDSGNENDYIHFHLRKADGSYLSVLDHGRIVESQQYGGMEMGLSDIEEIVKENQDVVVVVDEAYVDFGAVSSLQLIEKYDNLLVVQTFSKSRGMAGMRIGYAMGNPKLIKYLNDVKYSFN